MELVHFFDMKNIILSILILIVISCRNRTPDIYLPPSKENAKELKEKLININKQLVKKDSITIANYIEKKDWNMRITETGLWYEIYEKGNGKKAKTDNYASFEYTTSLTNDEVCYTSKETGPKEFLIGQGGVEKGLEEGILLLHEGDKARFILPPYLAHGLVGDGNCIPARAVVIYDVELISIKDK